MIRSQNRKNKTTETRWSPGRRWRFISAGILVLFVLYSMAGFLVLPTLVKHFIPKLSAENLDLKATVQKVRVNPYVLSLRLQQFAADTFGGQRLLAFEDLYVNLQFLRLLRLRFQFKEIALQGLEVAAKDGHEPVFSLPSLTVRDVEADTRNKTLGIDSVKIRAARLKGWLNPDGRLELLSALAPFEGREALLSEVTGYSEVVINKWRVTAREILLDDNALDFEDRTIDPPFRSSLKPIRVELKRFTNRRNTPTQVFVDVQDETGGSVTFSGETTVQPLSADLDVVVDGVSLRQFEPYIQTVATIDLKNGQMHLKGRIIYSPEIKKRNSKMGFQGRFGILNLEAVDSSSAEPVFKLPELAVSEMDFALAPNRLRIQEMALRRPQAELRIDPDGNLNLKSVLKSDREGVEGIKRSLLGQIGHALLAQIKGPMPFRIDQIRIEEAHIKTVDLSVQPPFFITVEPLNVSLADIDSARKAAAIVDFDGVVAGGALLNAEGQVEPFSDERSARMQVSLKNFDITTLSSYSGKYAGYTLQKGRLSLSLAYALSQTNVNGTNDIFLEKLTLGERIDSPDAVDLPLELAVALLKDREDNITLTVPIRGNLDDPEFQIGGVLVNTLVRLITSVVTSPFAVLGDIAGAFSAEELREIAFRPGSDSLAAAERDKLSKLAMALGERPSLRLEITATADKTLDRQALFGGETEISDAALSDLARRRARAIRTVIVENGRLEPERIIVVRELIDATPEGNPVASVLSVSIPKDQ